MENQTLSHLAVPEVGAEDVERPAALTEALGCPHGGFRLYLAIQC